MDEFNEETAIILGGGGVEYSAKKAAISIDELIDILEEAKAEGAETVLMSSGNYRGAQWSSIRADYSWVGDN